MSRLANATATLCPSFIVRRRHHRRRGDCWRQREYKAAQPNLAGAIGHAAQHHGGAGLVAARPVGQGAGVGQQRLDVAGTLGAGDGFDDGFQAQQAVALGAAQLGVGTRKLGGGAGRVSGGARGPVLRLGKIAHEWVAAAQLLANIFGHKACQRGDARRAKARAPFQLGQQLVAHLWLELKQLVPNFVAQTRQQQIGHGNPGRANRLVAGVAWEGRPQQVQQVGREREGKGCVAGEIEVCPPEAARKRTQTRVVRKAGCGGICHC